MREITSTVRWHPKAETLTLDGLKPGDHPRFLYLMTRNGYNVALYGGKFQAEADIRDRKARFPADDWMLIDRQETTT